MPYIEVFSPIHEVIEELSVTAAVKEIVVDCFKAQGLTDTISGQILTYPTYLLDENGHKLFFEREAITQYLRRFQQNPITFLRENLSNLVTDKRMENIIESASSKICKFVKTHAFEEQMHAYNSAPDKSEIGSKLKDSINEILMRVIHDNPEKPAMPNLLDLLLPKSVAPDIIDEGYENSLDTLSLTSSDEAESEYSAEDLVQTNSPIIEDSNYSDDEDTDDEIDTFHYYSHNHDTLQKLPISEEVLDIILDCLVEHQFNDTFYRIVIMSDPVSLSCPNGVKHYYDRPVIKNHLEKYHVNPYSNVKTNVDEIVSEDELKKSIESAISAIKRLISTQAFLKIANVIENTQDKSILNQKSQKLTTLVQQTVAQAIASKNDPNIIEKYFAQLDSPLLQIVEPTSKISCIGWSGVRRNSFENTDVAPSSTRLSRSLSC